LMYWYQFLALSHDGQITLDGTYSSDQAQALLQWLNHLALSNPALCTQDNVESEEKLLVGFYERKSYLEAIQDYVPQLRDDPAVDTRLEMLWRTLVLDMTGEQSERMHGFCSIFNCMFGWEAGAEDFRDSGKGGTYFACRNRAELLLRANSESRARGVPLMDLQVVR